MGHGLLGGGPIDRSRTNESFHNVGMLDNANVKEAITRPIHIRYIPAQQPDDHNVPSFLFVNVMDETGRERWLIERRFGPRQLPDGTMEESYIQVYPSYQPQNERLYHIEAA